MAAMLGLPIQISEEISETDFGQWTGCTLQEIDKDPQWQLYSTFRAGASAPGGEDFLQVQNRMAHWIERIRREHRQGHIAAVSHCDPIRAAATYYAPIHLNAYSRFEIDRASVTAIRIDDHGRRFSP